MPDYPIPPEHEPESEDQLAKDEPTQVDPPVSENVPDVDIHDLPTLIDLEADDDETDDLFPVKTGAPADAGSGLRNDPRRTLVGSGGFDPNPDFEQSENSQTMPHIVPFEHTLVHIPGEEPHTPLSRPRPPASQTIPAPPQMTQQRALLTGICCSG